MGKFSLKCCVLRLLVFGVLFSYHTASAQNSRQITLTSESISIADIFKAVKQQTGLTVFYNNQLLNDKEKMKVNFVRADISSVFSYVLKDKQDLEWTINDQFIILRKKEISSPALSDQKKTGKVTDDNDIPLSGATVTVKGTKTAVMTDPAGNFSIVMPEGSSVLVINYVGYDSREITVKNNVPLTIKLQRKDASLEDVVVIGYGTSTRRDLTGSVGKANVADMQKAPVPSFDQALAGRIAGVNVTPRDGQPGAAASISIRGSSVTQDASPLFVIDGFPIENMDINSINPNDIASFEVLKDASSIAIYGARGANGVILITTKRGSSGPVKLTYNFNYGIQRPVKTIDMMSPYEFVKLQLELDSIRSSPANPVNTYRNIYLGLPDPVTGQRPYSLDYYKTVDGYDWQDLLLRTGIQQSHSLNITGGNADTRYSLNGSYFDQKGVIINTGLKRYEGKFTLDQRIRRYLRVGITAGYSKTVSYGTIPAASFSGGVVQGMWQYRPVSGVGSQDLLNNLIDSLAFEDFNNGNSSATLGNNLVNPLIQAENEYRKNASGTGTLNAFIELTPLKNFTLRLSGGYNTTNVNSETFYNSRTQQGNLFKNNAGAVANTNGINGSLNGQVNSNYLSENVLTYRGKIGKRNSINAMGGFTYQYATNSGTGFRSINIPQSIEDLGIKSLGGGTAGSPYSGGTRWQLFSFISRLNYTFNDRYLLTLTGRADGSSKFAPGRQWGYFPSGAVAWRFTEESFFEKIRGVLSDGKIRVSYGSVGNNRVGDFSYMPSLAAAGQFGYPFANVYTRGSVPFSNGNIDLRWETTTQLDVGLNLSFWKDRISVDADYYHKRTKDFLLLLQLPYLAGYSGTSFNYQYQNTGVVSNGGFELTINTVNIKRPNFNWNSSFNISFNRGKIMKFYDGFQVMETGLNLPGGNSTTAWIATEGGPISQFYGYVWGGVYQYSDFDKLANGKYSLKPGVATYSPNVQPGDPKYKDVNADGAVTTADQTVLGTPLPLHTGGFSNNFQYKNFLLNIFFQWSYGNDVLNANRMAFETTGGYFPNGNQFAEYANRWTPANPTNDIPRAQYNLRGDVGNGVPRVTSRLIEDASFLRLKTVSLSYDIPKKIVSKAGMSMLRVFVSAQNLYTFTKYSGIDPEVSTFRVQNAANSPFLSSGGTVSSGTGYTFIQPSSSYTALSGGLDYTAYPRAFVINFGITATF
jgi:TonB-linked SusC/RagA family outer membrane protein